LTLYKILTNFAIGQILITYRFIEQESVSERNTDYGKERLYNLLDNQFTQSVAS